MPELISKPIAIQSRARFEEKTVKTREVYTSTPTEDEAFFTEADTATMRNGFN